MLNAYMAPNVDWLAIRKGLADQRLTSGVSPEDLAKKITAAGEKINKTTIYRIENVSDREAHKPRLETIALWLKYTSGITLSSFFGEVISQTNGDLKRAGETGITAMPPEEGTRHARGSRALPAPYVVAARTVAQALLDASMAITVALDGGELEQSDRSVSSTRSKKRLRR